MKRKISWGTKTVSGLYALQITNWLTIWPNITHLLLLKLFLLVFFSFHHMDQSPFQIHWKRYPEFQIVVQSEQGKNTLQSTMTSVIGIYIFLFNYYVTRWSTGQRSSEMKFRNPYDKGVLQNVKEFMASKQWDCRPLTTNFYWFL